MARGTGQRTLRISADLWEAFGAAITRAHPAPDPRVDRSTVLRQFIRWYVREPGAQLPERPPE